MKRLLFVMAFVASASAFAGFSDAMDLDALNKMLEIDASIDQIDIAVNGTRANDIWTPADISAEKDAGGNLTGNVVYNGDGMTYGINSAKGYISFGQYDDEASLNAFFMRDDFLNSRGDIMYLLENLRDCYTKAEDANINQLEEVVNQVTQNAENFLAREESAGRSGGSKSAAMINAYNEFYKSYENAVKGAEERKKNLIAKFASLRASATNKNKLLILDTMMRAEMDNYSATQKLSDRIRALYAEFKTLRTRYMTDMNTVGAYLGSTNAMDFVDANKAFEDMTADEIARWYKFTPPQLIDNSRDVGIKGLRGFDTIFPFLLAGYFPMALGFDNLSAFLSVYKEVGEFSAEDIRGWHESVSGPPQNEVTNWYANKITAPVNWADGSTLIVTNGKFKVASAAPTAWVWEGGSIRNGRIQVGTEIVDANNGAPYATSAAGDYYAHLFIPEAGTRTITINQSATGGDFAFKVCTVTGTGTNQVCTFQLAAMPVICVYE